MSFHCPRILSNVSILGRDGKTNLVQGSANLLTGVHDDAMSGGSRACPYLFTCIVGGPEGVTCSLGVGAGAGASAGVGAGAADAADPHADACHDAAAGGAAATGKRSKDTQAIDAMHKQNKQRHPGD